MFMTAPISRPPALPPEMASFCGVVKFVLSTQHQGSAVVTFARLAGWLA
jgi:hypothetical protein